MVLMIYAQMLPIFALVLTLATFISRQRNVLPSLLSAMFWLASAFSSTHITFIGDFGGSPSYTADGTSDILAFFGLMGVFMFAYSALVILQFSAGALQEEKQ